MRNWEGEIRVELPKSKGTQNLTFGNCIARNIIFYQHVNKGQRSWSPTGSGGMRCWPAGWPAVGGRVGIILHFGLWPYAN
ncbi:unnamed protein product [Prunus armeniaca]